MGVNVRLRLLVCVGDTLAVRVAVLVGVVDGDTVTVGVAVLVGVVELLELASVLVGVVDGGTVWGRGPSPVPPGTSSSAWQVQPRYMYTAHTGLHSNEGAL